MFFLNFGDYWERQRREKGRTEVFRVKGGWGGGRGEGGEGLREGKGENNYLCMFLMTVMLV